MHACSCFVLLVHSWVSSATPCSVQFGGNTFDFSPLQRGFVLFSFSSQALLNDHLATNRPNDVAWTALSSSSSQQFELNVCAPLPSASNQCSDPNSAACALVNGQYVTLGTYTSAYLLVSNSSQTSFGGFILSYNGGAHNQNATSPAHRDGTCNGLYDRETVILFTCGQGMVCCHMNVFDICFIILITGQSCVSWRRGELQVSVHVGYRPCLPPTSSVTAAVLRRQRSDKRIIV